MASKFPLDLKHFKKLSSDKHSTTLKHKNGHEIKVVHSALSPDLRKAVESLPSAEAAQPEDSRAQSFASPIPKKEIDSKEWSGDIRPQARAHYAFKGNVSQDDVPQPSLEYDEENPFSPNKQIEPGTPEYDTKAQQTNIALARQKANHAGEFGKNSPELDQSTQQDPSVSTKQEQPLASDKVEADTSDPKYADQVAKDRVEGQDASVNTKPIAAAPAPAVDDNKKYNEMFNRLKMQYKAGNKATDTPGMSEEDATYMATEETYNQKIADQKAAAEQKLAGQKSAEIKSAKQKEMDQKAAYLGIKPAPADTAVVAANPNAAVAPAASPDAAASTTQPQQAPQAPAADNSNPYLSSLRGQTAVAGQGIEKEYEAGQMLQDAEVERQQSLEKASALAQQNLQDATEKFNNVMLSTDKETSAIASELKNGHIDENQFWHNKSAPSKIAGTIGLLLSGMGAATLGKESAASAYLDQQIKLNVENQRKMMDVKGNVLNSLLHKYNDRSAALAAYQIAVNKVVEANAAEQAAKMGTPMAKAAFLQLQANLANKSQGLATSLTRAMMQNEHATTSGAPGAAGVPNRVPTREDTDRNVDRIKQNLQDALTNEPDPEKQKQIQRRLDMFNTQYINGVGEFSQPVPEHVRPQIVGNFAYLKAAKAYEKFAKEHSSALDWADPQVRSQATVLAKEIGNSFNMATGGGASHAQQEDLSKLIPPPRGPFNQYDAIPTIKELSQFINIRNNELLKQYGYKDANKIPETKIK